MTGEYRYRLHRLLPGQLWAMNRRRILFCALNPSTATEYQDDPTVRRMVGFCAREGGSTMALVNLFAMRSTDPNALALFDDAIGPQNDMIIAEEARRADMIIAAWGAHRFARDRAKDVLRILSAHGNVYRLGEPAIDGSPRHPLYLPKDAPLVLHRAAS